jgi:hypothetical protein
LGEPYSIEVRAAYHIARYQALGVRKLYASRLKRIARRRVEPARELERDVVYFSCRNDLPEQVASIRSLIRHVGTPSQLLVVSDGSHSKADRDLLRSIGEPVSVVDYGDFASDALPDVIGDYARTHAFGKKLGVLMSLPLGRAAMYVDSDVLFFPGALSTEAREAFSQPGVWYLPTPEVTFIDKRLVRSPDESTRPANAGFLFCDQRLRWEEGLARLPENPPTGKSGDALARAVGDIEQTLVHLAIHHSDAQPLPASLFQLRIDDQFLYRDFTPWRTAAMRHYTNTVRNKFWLAVAGVNRIQPGKGRPQPR